MDGKPDGFDFKEAVLPPGLNLLFRFAPSFENARAELKNSPKKNVDKQDLNKDPGKECFVR